MGAASTWLKELLRNCENVCGGGGRIGISAETGAAVGAGVRVVGGTGGVEVLVTSSPARSMRAFLLPVANSR